MTPDEFVNKQDHLSITAGMNQRYHQIKASKWTGWQRSVEITVGVVAVAGACLAVAALSYHSTAIDIVSVVVASIAALFAVALNVLPFGDWAAKHADLFRRWTDLREEVDSLLFSSSDQPSDEATQRLQAIDGKIHRICASEPRCDEELLSQCYKKEMKSRTVSGEPTPCGA